MSDHQLTDLRISKKEKITTTTKKPCAFSDKQFRKMVLIPFTTYTS